MSKDIRSFFKPLTATKSSNETKINKASVPNVSPGKSAVKRSSKEKSKTVKAEKSLKSTVSPKTKNLKSKSKTETRKKEVVSSDSDCDIVEETPTKQKQIVDIKKGKSSKLKKENEVKNVEPPKEKHQESSLNSKKLSTKSTIIENDSDDDIISQTPNRTINKKRKLRISSDSEDDIERKPITKNGKPLVEEKLKPVNVTEFFSGKVTQSKVKTAPILIENKTDGKKIPKSKKAKTELGIHEDEDFEKTLIDLDNDIFLQNEDILDKTIESALDQNSKTSDSKSGNNGKSASLENISGGEIKMGDNTKLPKKRSLENAEGETPSKSKRTKLNHTDSGFDDEERYERKRYSSMQYQNYLNRAGPKNHGLKELPKGKSDCLSNLTFLRTGVLDSLESDEFENLVKCHGGRVVISVSKKVNYVVVGEEPGPSKLQKAENYKIPTISEDELLDMILEKSGMPKKYTLTKKVSSFEDAGINDSFVSNDNEDLVEKKKFDIEERKEKVETKEKIEQKTDVEVCKQETKVKTEVNPVNVSLSEKYKPKDLKQIVGQQLSNSNMNRLKKWLEYWHRNDRLRRKKQIVQPKPWDKCNDGGFYKCALLSGPPGVGKTTTATLVAESLGFDIVEFNASDTRSKKLLQQEVATALNSRNIASFKANQSGLDDKRVILMDEVDGMAGNEDRGGMQELISLIKTSKVPIICMCNDRNHQKMKTLANYCFDLRFEKPKPQQILGFVMSICCKENIKVTPQIATEIINGTTCDIRQTLNQLSMLSNLDEGISLEQARKDATSSKKDTILGPWQVCKMVFNESDHKGMSLIDRSRLFFYDYSMGPLFVQENYLKVQPRVDRKLTMKHVAAAAEAISMGASIDKKIRESNNWSLLDLEAIYSSVLPGYLMSGQFAAAVDFPSWLGKNSKRNKLKRMTMELSSHTRIQTSGGELAMNLDYSKALLMSIVTPLKKRGVEGVSDAVEVMKTYQLLREDLDNLVEITSGASKKKNLMDGVETKVKAAFTRLYNKEVPIFSYSANAGVSKKKTSTLYEDDDLNEEETDGISEPEDSIENDTLIKAKSKSKATQKKDTSKASTSKQGSKTKGKGKK